VTTVWIYVDTRYHPGHPDHIKVFPVAADEWFKENDPEGAAFEYEVLWRRRETGRCGTRRGQPDP
jgi:LmbE family N-acetylglucosaminyl deacetylase